MPRTKGPSSNDADDGGASSGRDSSGIPTAVLGRSAFDAAVFAGIFDAVLGFFRAGQDPPGAGDLAASLAWAVLAGSAIGIGAAALAAALAAAVGCLPATVRTRAWHVLVFGALIAVNRNLFAGGSVSKSAWLRILFAAGVVSAAVAARVIVRAAKWLADPARTARAAVPLLALALAALHLNASLYPGLYLEIHMQEMIAAILLLQAVILLVTRRSAGAGSARILFRGLIPRVALAGLAAAILISAGPEHARPARAGVAGRAPLVREGLKLLRWLGIGNDAEPRTGDGAFLAGLLARDTTRDRALLDAAVPDRRRLNVLLLSIDTLRADAVGHLGGRPETTPVLDALAREAVVFEQAYTPYPTSNYAYSSLLSGLHASVSPAADAVRPGAAPPPSGTALPEILARSGRRTIGITAFNRETATDRRWFGHLRDGFDVYNPDQADVNATAPEVVRSAIRQIGTLPADPWLLWVHVLDPHAPYEPRSGSAVGDLRADYLREVTETDQELGRLLDRLREQDLLDRTIIVAHSDHGEEFGEHGGSYHNTSLHEEQVHVPLFVRVPGLPARRVRETVSLADLLPTLLEVLEIQDSRARTGRSLVPFLVGTAARESGYAFAELGLTAKVHRPTADAVWHGSWKLIRDHAAGTRQIYDLATDPGERRNLIGAVPERERRLFGLLEALRSMIDGHTPSGPDPETVRAAIRKQAGDLGAEIVAGGPDADDSAAALARLILDTFGNPRPDAVAALGAGGFDSLIHRLVRAVPTLDASVATSILFRFVARPRWRPVLPELKRLWAEEHGPRTALAATLALLDDPVGREDLLRAADQHQGFDDVLAIALASIGDVKGIAWIHANVRCGAPDLLAPTLRVLHQIPLEEMSRFYRGRLRVLDPVPVPVGTVAVEALVREPTEESTALLAWLAQSPFAALRDQASAALRTRLPAEAASRELAAAAIEVEGHVAFANHRYDLAVRRYREAIAAGGLERAGLRLEILHALRLAGRRDDAAGEALKESAVLRSDWAKARAARLVALAPHPVRLVPGTFGIGITPLEAFPPVLPNGCFSIGATIRNTGAQAWTGGPAPFGAALRFGFLTASGELILEDRQFTNWLPEEGVLPGESITVPLFGRFTFRARPWIPVLVFEQEWLELPDRGIVHLF